MNNARCLAKPLLWFHLFVCLVWLCIFRSEEGSPGWMGHVIVWSILGIQFTWGLTVGLLVGPSRSRRHLLWWSLLTIFLPLWPLSIIALFMSVYSGIFVAMLYLSTFVMILACETFCGVLLGVKLHSKECKKD